MSRYADAEWVPWRYLSDTGQPTYFKGTNQPTAVVLHIMQGYMSTARQWALTGHYGASWHFSVGRDGTVMQHLDFEDGGYHAGIASPPAPRPTWSLWQGSDINVNNYTIGIEHEGFSGEGFTEAQRAASKELCQWLAEMMEIPYDRERFPPHADIDVVNRVNDFAPPAQREEHYRYLFDEEDDMTPEERKQLADIHAALTGGLPGVLEAWNENGNSLLVGYTQVLYPAVARLDDHLANHAAGVTGQVTEHTHEGGKVRRP